MRKPSEYGVSLGPYKPISPNPFHMSLREGGIDTSMPASQLPEGMSPNALDVQMDEGGVSNDYGRSDFGTASAAAIPAIHHVAPYEKDDGTDFVMRLRQTGWDRWNGGSWAALAGALSGVISTRYNSLVMQNLFVAANGVDRLKSWNGSDVSAVQDLSADAPRAEYITRIGNRILAASIRDGGGILDPMGVAWCADGNILDWTSAIAGAGAASLHPEGHNQYSNHIKGISTLARGAVIYRQRSIVLASLTGVGAAPFRFTTIDFSRGTQSPYSIASGGPEIGDFFLGSDHLVYIFNGEQQPIPIGIPIWDDLLRNVTDLRVVSGGMDTRHGEYWLCIPTDADDSFLHTAYIFSVKEWARSKKMVWRKRQLQANTLTVGFTPIPAPGDPIVDTVTNIVDTVNRVVDSYTAGVQGVVFGHDDGVVSYIDESLALVSGTWESKQFGSAETDREIDTIAVSYKALTTAQIEVAVSVNSGVNYQSPRILNLTPTASGEREVVDTFKVTGKVFQVRIRILAGHCTVTRLTYGINDRGRRAVA